MHSAEFQFSYSYNSFVIENFSEIEFFLKGDTGKQALKLICQRFFVF